MNENSVAIENVFMMLAFGYAPKEDIKMSKFL